MKILVPTKRVPDTDQKIAAASDGSSVEIDHLPFVVNPFDAIALEEAVRISERLPGVDVVAIGVGEADYEQQIRTALAMGAARGILIQCSRPLDPWNVARLLQAAVEREQPDLVLMGKQAVDDDANQTGQFLAALLDWPQATFASRIDFVDSGIRVQRETDHGLETLLVPLPAVITVDLRLNEPRYASMAGIMKARKKPLETIAAEELGVSLQPRVEVLRYHSNDSRRRGERLESVDQLAELLRQEGMPKRR
ncbi:MAG: electron transfer flavoprotein subunit beta/FixA family protein [Pirellulales bacterium]|nr:electron transfer flavoprotein subunit beta/FixA family protein [Pirellulales bacterium]